jgi:uncharacterized membrane protein
MNLYLLAIISIVGGIMASSSFIVSKKADAKELLDKLVPFQGIVGIVLLVYSVRYLLFLFRFFSLSLLIWVSLLFIVGFLLSYGLLSKYVLSKNEEAKEKGQELRAKLVKFQAPAGIALAILAILSILRIF